MADLEVVLGRSHHKLSPRSIVVKGDRAIVVDPGLGDAVLARLESLANTENKRRLLKTVLSNLAASGKNVEITLAIPFQRIAEREKHRNGGPYRGTCRTWEQIETELIRYFETNPAESEETA